jgi:hypothetical protein
MVRALLFTVRGCKEAFPTKIYAMLEKLVPLSVMVIPGIPLDGVATVADKMGIVRILDP